MDTIEYNNNISNIENNNNNNNIINKKCYSCGIVKNINEYYKQSANKDGYNKICRLCKKKDNKETYEKFKDKYKQVKKETRELLTNSMNSKKYIKHVKICYYTHEELLKHIDELKNKVLNLIKNKVDDDINLN
jgi:hypothetical protein